MLFTSDLLLSDSRSFVVSLRIIIDIVAILVVRVMRFVCLQFLLLCDLLLLIEELEIAFMLDVYVATRDFLIVAELLADVPNAELLSYIV